MSVYTYVDNFAPDSGASFERLRAELSWVQRENTPRQEYWTNHDNRPYTYGRGRGIRTYEAQETHDVIDLFRDRIKSMEGVYLEGCFLNLYPTSHDHLGWHADDDPGIDHSKPIAVITLGQGRPIQLREIITPEAEGVKGQYGPVETIMLDPGSLLLMHAGCQFTHQHKIPKVGRDIGARISLTYRGLLAQEGPK